MEKIHYLPQDKLMKTAEALVNQGFSVLPICGDSNPHYPKKPASTWKQYQRRLPHIHEIHNWFKKNITAIGIVCGQISQLLVIDFDDHFTYRNFCKVYPTYSKTFTVKTKRGYHLYYHIQQTIPSYQFTGGDVKGEKSYVIAPPSTINSYTYIVTNNVPQQSLLLYQIDEILNFLQVTQHTISLSNIPTSNLSLDLCSIYESLVPQIGRNNALYRTASIARRQGIAVDSAKSKLVSHHITMLPLSSHLPETPEQRYIEADRTITSAYTTPASTGITIIGVPNSIRESLLQTQNSTITSRLLDIFALAKWKPNYRFSLSDAIHLAHRYGLNRKSVMRALTGDLSEVDGQNIIIRKPVEYPDTEGLNSRRRGRPIEILYQVPSMDYLLKLFNVNLSPSDYISKNDVQSAHAYRIALHREYIKRLSPQVPMAWLAKRIGVNVRTIQRYNRELAVQITQNLGYFSLLKTNLDTLPRRHQKISKNATNGFWLETEDGQRFPAWRHIGSRLLKTHLNQVKVCLQRPSKLTLADADFDPETIEWQLLEPTEFVRIQAFRSCTDNIPKLKSVVDRLFGYVKQRVNQVRYQNFKLHFDTVVRHIAKDDVAETITSYLYAYDEDGNRVQRPAKRGIAYRMLKEFGNGNVFLALLDQHTEMFYALARHAQNFGHLPSAMKFLLSALD